MFDYLINVFNSNTSKMGVQDKDEVEMKNLKFVKKLQK